MVNWQFNCLTPLEHITALSTHLLDKKIHIVCYQLKYSDLRLESLSVNLREVTSWLILYLLAFTFISKKDRADNFALQAKLTDIF